METSQLGHAVSLEAQSLRRPQSITTDTEPRLTASLTASSEPVKLTFLQIMIIMTCLSACVFIAALDITIVSTALPTITNQARSASGYTWIGSLFVLAHASTTPLWGRIPDIWERFGAGIAAGKCHFHHRERRLLVRRYHILY